MRLKFALFIAALLPMGAVAVELQCHENSSTNAMQCVAPSQVKEKDGIRSAPLYTGGPNGVRLTKFTVHVNCKTSVLHLKDRDGVSFAGGTTNTKASRDLQNILCEAKPPSHKR